MCGCFKSKSSYSCIYTDWFLLSIYKSSFLCPLLLCVCMYVFWFLHNQLSNCTSFGKRIFAFCLWNPDVLRNLPYMSASFMSPLSLAKDAWKKEPNTRTTWHRLILWDTSLHAYHWLTHFGLPAVMERARFWMSDIALLLLSCTSRKKCFTCEIVSFGKKQAVLCITWEVMGYKLSKKHCFLFSLNLPWLYIYGSYWVFFRKKLLNMELQDMDNFMGSYSH